MLARRFTILGCIILAWMVIFKIWEGGPHFRSSYGVPPDASIHGSFDLRRKEFETLLREVRKDDVREDLAPYMLAAHVKQIEHARGAKRCGSLSCPRGTPVSTRKREWRGWRRLRSTFAPLSMVCRAESRRPSTPGWTATGTCTTRERTIPPAAEPVKITVERRR